ncbi:MAG: hypothetical protein ACTSRP_02760 [Candidatus Helarchaeota archaeon]
MCQFTTSWVLGLDISIIFNSFLIQAIISVDEYPAFITSPSMDTPSHQLFFLTLMVRFYKSKTVLNHSSLLASSVSAMGYLYYHELHDFYKSFYSYYSF